MQHHISLDLPESMSAYQQPNESVCQGEVCFLLIYFSDEIKENQIYK